MNLVHIHNRYETFINDVLLDADGLLRSFLNLHTLRPWTNEELKPYDLTFICQNSPDPAGCLTYENSLMATGEYALSQVVRHQATGEGLEAARRGCEAILKVASEGAHYMPGHLPKPFRGLSHARDSHEISPDQYIKVILALHGYRHYADETTRKRIDAFFMDVADFFVARKFRHAYRHRTIVTAQTHIHALSLYLPILVLAGNISGEAKYHNELKQFDEVIDTLPQRPQFDSYNKLSLLAEGFHLALSEGHDDRRLRDAIGSLWKTGVDFTDKRHDRSERTRLGGFAGIVHAYFPEWHALEECRVILAKFDDPADLPTTTTEDETALPLTHRYLPHTHCEAAATSWLLAYWRMHLAQQS